MTLIRFRDCGSPPTESSDEASAVREPPRKKTGAPRRVFLRLATLTAVWLFGLVAGGVGVRFVPFEKWVKAPNAQSDGEYVVENLPVDPTPSPVREPLPAGQLPRTDVVREPAKIPAADPNEWSGEVLETVALIPPWNPSGDIPDYVPAVSAPRTASDSLKTAGAFRPAEPIPAPQVSAPEKNADTLTAARPQPIAEVTPSKPASAEEIAPTEDFSNPSTEQIAKNESRPMKNQIEYFEPFETVSFSSREPESAVKVTASEDFYNDAYGVDNFSDYVPPRRGEEEIPSSDSVFGKR